MAKKNKEKIYVKCVKRHSQRINKGKWEKIVQICHFYAREKDSFLETYGSTSYGIYAASNFREIRNSLVKEKYKSRFALQARVWKLALKDALETIDRYWSAQISFLEDVIYKDASLLPKEKKLLLKAISTPAQLYDILTFKEKSNLLDSLNTEESAKIVSTFEKIASKVIKKSPRVKIERSFIAEPETYRIFEHNGRQYIAITSLEKGKRICIPLKGKGDISGQIRIVLNYEKQAIEVHHVIKAGFNPKPKKVEKIGIDFGITEVFTDSQGERFGTKFGQTLEKISTEQKEKGQKRNKIYAVWKKHRAKKNYQKARKIRKQNLGKKKLKKRLQKRREELAKQVNQALNVFFDTKEPEIVVYENLSNLRGKAKSKQMSRLVSAWIRTTIDKRLQFKASQRCSLLVAVNPAYTSSVCPVCDWVAKGNRNGDRFKCLFCGHSGVCDYIAACEILKRENEPEITLQMPKEQVRMLLISKFCRRLESEELAKSLSQANWEAVRKEITDKETIAKIQNVEKASLDATVPGKTSETLSTTYNHRGRNTLSKKIVHFKKESHSKSETNSLSVKTDFSS